MSEQVDTSRTKTLAIYAWIAVPVALLGGVLVLTMFRGGKIDVPSEKDRGRDSTNQENHLASVRSTLAREADLTTCRTIVANLNSHLNQRPAGTPLDPKFLSELKALLLQHEREIRERQLDRKLNEKEGNEIATLVEGDLAELTSTSYTSLDAHHLETCFLLRDAARSLELPPPAGRGGKPVRPTPLERATLAFAWVCRQVRLAPSVDPLPAPPGFVLRRGSGSALERGIVFLALLEQFGLLQDDLAGLQGCLLFVPGRKRQPELWACGVTPADEPTSIYLFDPRLGLPLPGPDGKGIATLKQARDEPAVLGQLKIDKVEYDVTPKRAATAEAAVYAPLTALSPRMRYLQERLLRDKEIDDRPMPAAVRVKLAEEEPGALAAIRKAFEASGGKGAAVKYWREGATLLRRFVPKDEGGSDTGVQFPVAALKGFSQEGDPLVVRLPRSRLLQLASVPWEDFPEIFRDRHRFRFDLGIGQGVRAIYATPFIRWLSEPNSPREMVIRGQLTRATPKLVEEQEQWVQAKLRRMEPEQLNKGVDEWIDRATKVFADQVRAGGPDKDRAVDAEVNKLWRWKIGEPMDVLISQAVADARGSEVTFQLALCKHEQAVRHQARLDLAARAGVKTEDDVSKAHAAWSEAAHWWRQYLQSYDKRAGAPAARRLLGEAQLGQDERESAAKTWAEAAAGVSEPERLAALWLAKQTK